MDDTKANVLPDRTGVVIIGAGFGGLCMAIQLKAAGVDDFVVLEKADSVGGTWRDNTYPGAACDVQSHLYSYSFAPKHDWSRKFGEQAEIRAYMEDCATRFGVRAHLRFGIEVSGAAFDETTRRWQVRTASGVAIDAQCVVTATGALNRPAWPAIPGLDDFAGTLFHSARWDHTAQLAGKRIGVIGTGASAIQFVPRIVPAAQSLTLFQRSAAWVMPKPDRPFTRIEQALFRTLHVWDRIYRALIYWKNETRALGFTVLSPTLRIFASKALRNMRRHVRDPDKRAALTPDYAIGCKRILISNDYYPALAQDHVTVETTGIDHVESGGVVLADGRRVDVDALILGTGFKATEFLSPMTITGLDGQDLNAAWSGGASAYKGITVHGFPNLFMLYGPNTNLAHNSIIVMLEAQVGYIVKAITRLRARGGAMHPRADVQAAFDARLQAKLGDSVWASGCASWYVDANGKITNMWPGFTATYRWLTRKVDDDDFHWLPAIVSAPSRAAA